MKNERKPVIKNSAQFSPLSIARMLWKKRLLICLVWVATTACAFFAIRAMPNVYEADAVVIVDSQKIPEKYVASTVQVTLQDSLNAIKQRVLAGDKLLQIIREFHLYEDDWNRKSPEELMDRLRSRDLALSLERGLGGNRGGAFRITFEGRSPKEVAGVVNRITDLFIRENAAVRERRAVGTAEFIESQLREAKKRLDEQEGALSQFKSQYAGELPEQATTLLAALSGLRVQLQGNRETVNRTQQNILILESTLRFTESSLQSITGAPASGTSSAAKSAVPAALLPKIMRPSDLLKQKLAELRLEETDQHPDVRRLRQQLNEALALEAKAAEAQKQMEATQTAGTQDNSPPPADTPPQVIAEINQLRDRAFSTKTQLDAARREITTLEAERNDLVQQIANYESRIEKLPMREQQYSSLMRDYDMSKVSYQQLLDRKYSAGIATAMEQSDESERFVVADPAREPGKPVRPKRAVYLAGGSFAGLFVGLALGFALEFKRNAFLGEWEVPPNVPILGRIPRMAGVPAPAGTTLVALCLIWGAVACQCSASAFRAAGGLL